MKRKRKFYKMVALNLKTCMIAAPGSIARGTGLGRTGRTGRAALDLYTRVDFAELRHLQPGGGEHGNLP